MKFRDKKTGEVFDDIFQARKPFCYRNECYTCAIPNFFREDLLPETTVSCPNYCTKFPREAARLMGYEVVEDKSNNKTMEVKQMKMNKVSAPVMGIYEVQDCPNCGAVPCIDVTVKRKENVDAIQYTLSEEVYCTCCGLSGTSVETWNKLRCVE